ncbi:MAG TPA: carbohydrate porin [Rhizomicrobium sp.]
MTKQTWMLAAAACALMMGPAFADPAPSTVPAADAQPGGDQADDAQPESWNWHAQNTDIYQGTAPFHAEYSGPHSLLPGGEGKETISADITAGVRLWSGGEFHVDGLAWQGFGLSHTTGLLAFPNAESYKAGTGTPNLMFSRLFLRQTFGFGGEQEDVPDGPFTLKGKQDVSRLTITVGRMSFADIFDHNAYANDGRSQFMSWAMVANLTWDYGQDTIGYSLGTTVELNEPDWTLRYGFFEMPEYINAGDFGSGNGGEDEFLTWPARGSFAPIFKSYSMATEFEYRFSFDSHPGAIRALAWLNHANIDTYKDATAILLADGPGADISPAQRYHYAYGFGLNLEQEIDKTFGLFSRIGWNDGETQALEFSDANWSISSGLSINGATWDRPDDTIGIGGVISGISQANQRFLNAGGLGIELGDGAISYSPEKALETYYDLELWKGIHGTFDYQLFVDPGANTTRGPASVFGIRMHAEI